MHERWTYHGIPWQPDGPSVGVPFWKLARVNWWFGTPEMRAHIARCALEDTLRDFQPRRG